MAGLGPLCRVALQVMRSRRVDGERHLVRRLYHGPADPAFDAMMQTLALRSCSSAVRAAAGVIAPAQNTAAGWPLSAQADAPRLAAGAKLSHRRARREATPSLAQMGAWASWLRPCREAAPPGRLAVLCTDEGTYAVSQMQCRGGYGKFRYAIDPSGHAVGLKEVRLPLAREGKTQATPEARLLTELAAMQAVGSPLYGGLLVRIDDKVYVLMPLLDGSVGDLGRAAGDDLQRAAVAYQCIYQVADALSRCHAAGLLHQDVKPGNVLYCSDGTMVLADYGLATELRGTPPSARGGRGTPMYMAPEALGGAPCGPSADIWSLGVTFVRLLCGTHLLAPDPSDAVRAANDAFLSYLRAMPREPGGDLDLEALRAQDDATTRRLQPLLQQPDPVVRFVLGGMFHPEAAARPPAAAVWAFFWFQGNSVAARQTVVQLAATAVAPQRLEVLRRLGLLATALRHPEPCG